MANGKDDIPYIMENKKNDWNHQPVYDGLFLYRLSPGARAHKDLQPSSAGTMHPRDAVHIDADLPLVKGIPVLKNGKCPGHVFLA